MDSLYTMAGRPKELTRYKHRKPTFDAGRHEERLNKLRAKQQKIEMLEALLQMATTLEEINNIKHRLHKKRAQFRVLSTVEFKERP